MGSIIAHCTCYFYGMSAAFNDPRENILHLALREGMKVVDLGTGSGHYALAAAAIVGSEGHVYAVDVQEDVLTHLKDSARRANRWNIDTIWGDFEKPRGTTLVDGLADAVIVSNVLFQIEEHGDAIKEILRITKPGGKLLVIDWAGSYSGMGPPQEHVVREHDAEALFITAGFHKVKSLRAGPHHYGILFTRP